MTAGNRRPLDSDSGDDGITGRPFPQATAAAPTSRGRASRWQRQIADRSDAAVAATAAAAAAPPAPPPPADPVSAAYAASLREDDGGGDEDASYYQQQQQQQQQQSLSLLPAGEPPCAVKALGSAAAAGCLGYVIGAVPAAWRQFRLPHDLIRQWHLVPMEAAKSARSLAIVSGTYALVHCLVCRVRLGSDDGLSRGAAGCATGLAMGFTSPGGGWAQALQSCAGFGLLSYVLDLGGGGAGGGGGGGGGGAGDAAAAHAAEVRRPAAAGGRAAAGGSGGGGVGGGASSSRWHEGGGAPSAVAMAVAAAGAALMAAARGPEREEEEARARRGEGSGGGGSGGAAPSWPGLLMPGGGGLPSAPLLAIGLLGGPCWCSSSSYVQACPAIKVAAGPACGDGGGGGGRAMHAGAGAHRPRPRAAAVVAW
jgi:hypothetical protein